jgi:hypothetical protein
MKADMEIVFFYLYDAGRSIDLDAVADIIPASQINERKTGGRDTPESLRLPHPLTIDIEKLTKADGIPFDAMTLQARVFEEGAISMCLRITGRFDIEKLHLIRSTAFAVAGTETGIERFVDTSFRKFFARVRGAITLEPYVFSEFVRETYAAYCIVSDVGDPGKFVARHDKAIACLLNGETEITDLHESQIHATLKGSFSYTSADYALFDLDRCLIIDPSRNYEDILLVVEQASFQLLELRALDQLLDRWLDRAEDDITLVFRKNKVKLRMVKRQIAGLQALGFDALFVLENLENTSKIIGDYFLGQIFANLCAQFDTAGWTRSIDRRLSTLSSVYAQVNTNENDRRLIVIEIVFIVVCIVIPLIQILQTWLVTR